MILEYSEFRFTSNAVLTTVDSVAKEWPSLELCYRFFLFSSLSRYDKLCRREVSYLNEITLISVTMASGGAVSADYDDGVKQIMEELTCSICEEEYRPLCALPCQHRFCKTCLGEALLLCYLPIYNQRQQSYHKINSVTCLLISLNLQPSPTLTMV